MFPLWFYPGSTSVTSFRPRWNGHLKQVGMVDSQVGEGLAILPEDHHDDGSGESESE